MALAAGAALTVMLTGIPAAVAPVAAVHNDGLFQLDYVVTPTPRARPTSAPRTSAPPATPVTTGTRSTPAPPSAFATAFVTDTYGTAENSFFTGGGSKDERDISGGSSHWEWDDTNDVIPDKDDITHAFAAAYVNPADGHTIFYFGADRFDTSGDPPSWGSGSSATPVTLGTKPDFNGVHAIGDILVLVNWGGGDRIGDMEIYQWVGGKNPLALLADNLAADCSLVALRRSAPAPWSTRSAARRRPGPTSTRTGRLPTRRPPCSRAASTSTTCWTSKTSAATAPSWPRRAPRTRPMPS